MSESVERARKYAIERHNITGCEYDGHPYEVHLQRVVDYGAWFIATLDPSDPISVNVLLRDEVRAALWLHDTLEDTNITYSDLKKLFGERVADIVYDVTNELGKNRKQRARRTYPKTAANPLAVFVKCCDRMANTTYSRETGSSMYDKYLEEYPSFRAALRVPGRFDSMWAELDGAHRFGGKA